MQVGEQLPQSLPVVIKLKMVEVFLHVSQRFRLFAKEANEVFSPSLCRGVSSCPKCSIRGQGQDLQPTLRVFSKQNFVNNVAQRLSVPTVRQKVDGIGNEGADGDSVL